MSRPKADASTPQQEFIQIDTTNILFICGGAFDGLDKYIQRRTDKSALGFGSSLKDNSDDAQKALLRRWSRTIWSSSASSRS